LKTEECSGHVCRPEHKPHVYSSPSFCVYVSHLLIYLARPPHPF